MKKASQGLLRAIATRTVIAAIPVAMASAYASNLFVPTPPRLAEYTYQQVAEIMVSPDTVGIAASPLYGQTKAQIDTQLDQMQALGVENIRVFVPWGLIEFNPVTPQGSNQYYWDALDLVMQAAKERNMGVLAEINSTPYWAAADGNPSYLGTASPDIGAYTAFVSDFAAKYGDIVSAYEIWNEPNAVLFSNPVDPAAYAALVKAAYQAIKPLDPTATVVAGAVGHVVTFGNLTMDPVEFVQAMIAADPTIANYFDALSYHPYDETMAFSAGNIPPFSNFFASDTAYNQVKDLMALLPTKKVWLTEFGVPTYSYTVVDGNGVTQTVTVTQQQQDALIKDLINTWGALGQAGPIFLYTGRDTATGSADPNANYGLYDQLGNPKLVVSDFLTQWFIDHPQNVTGPTNPPGPVVQPNPLAAFFQAFAAQIQNFVAQFQSFVNSFVQAIANLFGAPVAPAAVNTAAPLSLKVAAAAVSDTPGTVADVVPVAAAARSAKTADVLQPADVVATAAVTDTAAQAEVTSVAAAPEVAKSPVVEVAAPIAAAEPAVIKTPEPAASSSTETVADDTTVTTHDGDQVAGSATTSGESDKTTKTTKPDKTDKADKTASDGPEAAPHPAKDKGDNGVSANRVTPKTGSDAAGNTKDSAGSSSSTSSSSGSGSGGGGAEG